jgi:predicted membrane channel-forming protein YqfA (hemolysin III family)
MKKAVNEGVKRSSHLCGLVCALAWMVYVYTDAIIHNSKADVYSWVMFVSSTLVCFLLSGSLFRGIAWFVAGLTKGVDS